jgi:hypothetical protein
LPDPTNPASHPGWNDKIARLPGATIFHTANWAKVLVSAYNYRAEYFTSVQGAQISGCIPLMDIDSFITGRRGVALPFTDECNPLCRQPGVFEQLWQQAIDHGRLKGWKHIELRGGHSALGNAPPSSAYVVHRLDLEGGEKSLMNQFRDSTRRNISKAEKNGVQVQHSRTLDAVKRFYRLNSDTRRLHGLPPQPFRFFEALHRHVIGENLGFVQLAVYKNKTIAGAICLHFNRQVIYKYGASDKSCQWLRANNLIIWRAIQWGLENGNRQFSFGRTEPENAGLRQFKSGWGAEETDLRYYRYGLKQGRFCRQSPGIKTSYAIFSKLPVPLLRLAGRLLYRHMG